MNHVPVLSLSLVALLAGRATASPDYKAIALGAYHVEHATAETVFFHDCNESDPSGNVVCHTCGNELKVSAIGGVQAYADYNEQVISLSPYTSTARVVRMSELARHLTELQPQVGSLERDKGPVAFRTFLMNLLQDGNAWCARFGGERHDLKDVVDDASRGKYVEWK